MKYERFWLWSGMSAVYLLGAASYAYRGVFALVAVHLFLAVACFGWVFIMPTIDKPQGAGFLRLIGLKTDRQPMATAKSGGWERQTNWNHRPDGMRRPEPPPGPPSRVESSGAFVLPAKTGMATRRISNGLGIWSSLEAIADAQPLSAKERVCAEKEEIDARLLRLSGFMHGRNRGFDRLDQAEQDLLRHQCELMQDYSAVLGARIANWRDGVGK